MSLRTQTVNRSSVAAVPVASFLVVTCGETPFALSAGTIRGIVKPGDGGIADVLAALGVRTPVIDLAERWGFSSTLSSDAGIVVCGLEQTHRAFLVGAVVGLEDIDPSNILPLLPHFTGPERTWFSGMFLFRETVALIVDPRWLLSAAHNQIEESARLVDESAQEPDRTAPALADTSSTRGDPGPFDLMELEEATDADDIPWAQL